MSQDAVGSHQKCFEVDVQNKFRQPEQSYVPTDTYGTCSQRENLVSKC